MDDKNFLAQIGDVKYAVVARISADFVELDFDLPFEQTGDLIATKELLLYDLNEVISYQFPTAEIVTLNFNYDSEFLTALFNIKMRPIDLEKKVLELQEIINTMLGENNEQ